MDKDTINTMLNGPELFYNLLGTLDDPTGKQTLKAMLSLSNAEIVSCLFASAVFAKVLGFRASETLDMDYDELISETYFAVSMLATQTYVEIGGDE